MYLAILAAVSEHVNFEVAARYAKQQGWYKPSKNFKEPDL